MSQEFLKNFSKISQDFFQGSQCALRIPLASSLAPPGSWVDRRVGSPWFPGSSWLSCLLLALSYFLALAPPGYSWLPPSRLTIMAPPGPCSPWPLLPLATPGLDPLIPKPNVFPAQTDLAIAGRQMTLHQAAELA